MAAIDDIQAVERLMQMLDENPHLMEAVRSRVLTRELLELPQTVARLTERIDHLTEQMDRRFNRLADDLTWLKDVGAVTIADKHAMLISEDLGLEYEKQLTQREVRDLIRDHDTADIAPGDLRSFRTADMVIEATDAAGRLHYIAVEVSFTADQRDVDRPIRNAGYLTRCTGKPSHAVVASVRTDRRIEDVIASGQIHWHQLRDRSALRE